MATTSWNDMKAARSGDSAVEAAYAAAQLAFPWVNSFCGRDSPKMNRPPLSTILSRSPGSFVHVRPRLLTWRTFTAINTAPMTLGVNHTIH